MWHYNQTPDPDVLAHGLFGQRKNHKYIAKIGSGPNAKYFYTQAELAAYKAGKSIGKTAKNVGKYVKGAVKDYGKALSSKDEVKAYKNEEKKYKTVNAKLIDTDSRYMAAQNKMLSERLKMDPRKPSKAYNKAKTEFDIINNSNSAYKAAELKQFDKMSKAAKKADKAGTIKGKASDVAKTFAKRNQGAIKYVKGAVKDYGKALSSKDEHATFIKDMGKGIAAKSNQNEAFDKYNKAEKAYKNTINYSDPKAKNRINNAKNKRNAAYSKYAEATANFDNVNEQFEKSQKAYKKAKTLHGKAEDVVATFKKRNGKKKVKRS